VNIILPFSISSRPISDKDNHVDWLSPFSTKVNKTKTTICMT
jgi:hypothetical protein